MASFLHGTPSNSGVQRSSLSSVHAHIKPVVMAEVEQSGYVRPRYTVTVTGQSVSNDNDGMGNSRFADTPKFDLQSYISNYRGMSLKSTKPHGPALTNSRSNRLS